MRSKKGLILLSGGLDSPVAAYILKKRGFDLIGLHFSLEPVTGKAPENKSRAISEVLSIPLKVVNVSKQFSEISEKCRHRFYFVLTKRLMLRIAEKIAKRESASFIATGESLGQVSSQTLENLTVINQATEMPMIRPLVGMNKQEIINIAKKIGTYNISSGPEVCDVLGPEHPATKASLHLVLLEEERLDMEKLMAFK